MKVPKFIVAFLILLACIAATSCVKVNPYRDCLNLIVLDVCVGPRQI